MQPSSSSKQLRALSQSRSNNKGAYRHTRIDTKLLERFNAPHSNANNSAAHIHITAPEFTCRCPITAQPDFATIEIYYRPDDYCVESKSLKLYLGSFRNAGAFHEAVVTRIHDDLRKLLDPRWLLVIGRFAARGGIAFHPRVYSTKGPNIVPNYVLAR